MRHSDTDTDIQLEEIRGLSWNKRRLNHEISLADSRTGRAFGSEDNILHVEAGTMKTGTEMLL